MPLSRRPLAAAALVVAAIGATASAGPPATAAARQPLPPGVVALGDGEPCPPGTLCLYRDYGRQGPAYGIGAGYSVDLRELPMAGRGGTAADNVSSWVNNTGSPALLVDESGGGRFRPLFPGQELEEPLELNDSVDRVHWLP